MEVIRQRLIDRVETILLKVASDEAVPANSRLQIEAGLARPQDILPTTDHVLIDSIDIDELRHHLAYGARSTDAMPVAHPLPQASSSSSTDIMHSKSVIYSELDGLSLNVSVDSIDQMDDDRSSSHDGDQEMSNAQPGKTPLKTPSPLGSKHTLEDDGKQNSQKRQKQDKSSQKQQSAVDKLIEGIWEQIHTPNSLAMDDELTRTIDRMLRRISNTDRQATDTKSAFESITKCCQQVTAENRVAKFLEVIIQAHWIDRYDERLASLKVDSPKLRAHEYKRIVLTEACTSFGWSEKELRNRMAIWKGYREIKDAAGWSALVFAGTGIYRFCKYRLGFDHDSITKLQNFRTRAEVAADTLQPQWRQLLALLGESTEIRWQGHPHDWTVSLKSNEEPLPLAVTYRQWDLNFSFENIQESRVDVEQWQDQDPRQFEDGPEFYCKSCTLRQSDLAEYNECECFPHLYGAKPRLPCPVQIFRTNNGKNNGLIACCSFDRGQAVGEFTGLITRGLADVDVMQSQAGDHEPYQIWQGRCGNFTRFLNHSCAANCQFQTFSWLGIQRIVVVSKGISAGQELTVDYSSHYWDNLDKICLCGEPCCRYRDRRKKVMAQEVELYHDVSPQVITDG